MTIGERIKSRRIALGLSADDLALRLKKNRATVYRYESDEIEKLPTTVLEKLAEVLDVTPAYLMGWEESNITECPDDENPWEVELREAFDTLDIDSQIYVTKQVQAFSKIQGAFPIKKKKLPLLGNVACGEPIFAEQSFDAYVSVGSDVEADFCLRAKGDSMINARIFDGDILFVKSQPMVEDGEIAVVLVEDEATVKRVYYDRENNTITLVPENPTYKVMRFMGEQLNQIRILGKVIAGQYDVR